MPHSFAQAQPFRSPKTSERLVCQNRHEVVHSASRDVFDLLDPVPAQRGHWERPLEPPWWGWRWPSVVLLRIHQTARCRVLQLHQGSGHVCRTQGDLYLETLPMSRELHRRVSEWLARARTKERELAGGSSQAGAAWNLAPETLRDESVEDDVLLNICWIHSWSALFLDSWGMTSEISCDVVWPFDHTNLAAGHLQS